MFSLNRFLIIQMYLSGVPSSLPKKPPRERRGHCFWQIFEGDNRGSLSKIITRKTNIFIGEKIYAHFLCVCVCVCVRVCVFVAVFCDCRIKRLLASYSVQRERQIGAGAKCCGGEEGVCEECVWRRVPTRCQRGGILKQQSLSSSSVILSLHSPNV